MLFCISPLTRYRSLLTELSLSWRPSPLGNEDLRFVEEFLFGVELLPPAFFLTKRTSQLAWSSLCVLFPAFITLRKKAKQKKKKTVTRLAKHRSPHLYLTMWLKMYGPSPAVLQVLTELKYLTALQRYKHTHRHTCLFLYTYTWYNKHFPQNYVNKNQWCHEHISPLGMPYFCKKRLLYGGSR